MRKSHVILCVQRPLAGSVVVQIQIHKYKIKTYNAPYVTRVIRRRRDDTLLGSIGNAKKMTFESTFKNTNRNRL